MIKKVLRVMIAFLIVVAIAVGVFFGVKYTILLSYKRDMKELPADFTYTAHTGCCGTAANSVDSITVGESYGVDIVEFDLNFDKNQNPVLSHDEPKGGEVSLEEAFANISRYEKLQVNVDAKKYDGLWMVQDLAIKYGVLDRIFFTGITEKETEIVQKTAPDIKYYLNVSVKKPSKHTDEYLMSLVKKVKDAGAIGINFNKNNASQKLVDFFHENGLLVSIFTVDSEYEMYKILSYGPDNITTRNPDKLQEILKERE
jgi:glycerophosphoryl diester phosphodiesterase